MKIVKKNKTYFFNLKDEKEIDALNSYINKELDITLINDSTFVLSLREIKTNFNKNSIKENTINKEKNSKDIIKQKIIKLLSSEDLSFKDKVEGRFENILNKEDLEIFKEMLNKKEIILYKQSEKYKKAVYSVKTENFKQSEKINDKDNIFKEFYKNKYIIIKSKEEAENFSQKFYPKFKDGEIKGQKTFDNYFFAIDLNYYNQIKKEIQNLNLKTNFTIEEIIKKTNKSEELLKIVLEFLKEEGILIEKRKGLFCFI